MLFLPGAHIQLLNYNWQFQLVAKFLDKTGVRISFAPPEPMVDVGQNQLYLVVVAQSMKQMAEGHRVRSSRDGDQDPIACLKHSLSNNSIVDFFQQHRQPLQVG
jgi:hypothetical protein